jgi:hypothetical protein
VAVLHPDHHGICTPGCHPGVTALVLRPDFLNHTIGCTTGLMDVLAVVHSHAFAHLAYTLVFSTTVVTTVGPGFQEHTKGCTMDCIGAVAVVHSHALAHLPVTLVFNWCSTSTCSDYSSHCGRARFPGTHKMMYYGLDRCRGCSAHTCICTPGSQLDVQHYSHCHTFVFTTTVTATVVAYQGRTRPSNNMQLHDAVHF